MVGHGMTSPPSISTRSDDVGHGMTSPPLGSAHSRMTSGVACHHLLWEAKTVERRRCCMQTSPLGSTHGRTTSGVACQHRLWATTTVERRRAWRDVTSFGQRTRSNNVGCDMPSPPLERTHGRTKSGMACHHHLWATHTVGLRQAWHDITAFVQHTRSNGVGRGMPSSPLGSTHDRTMFGGACHNSPWTANTVE